MKKDLNWYAFYWDCNSNSLERTDVIHSDLIDDVKKAIKKGQDFNQIKEIIRCNLMWYYWSKSEWEVLVSDLHMREDSPKYKVEKIDVYYQLEPNLDRITEYMINNLTPRKRQNGSVSKN